jgi:transcription elongation factor SPT6
MKIYFLHMLLKSFAYRHLHESQNLGGAGAGGKTPFGAGGRTPGHATPGHMSVRNVGKTPNPYGGPRPGGGATPYGGAVPPASTYAQNTYGGYQTPSTYPPRAPGFPQQPPAAVPAGMNPARAAMIQQTGGWGQDSGSGGW